MTYKILAAEWRSARYTIGFIAYATENPANLGEWNSVAGPSLNDLFSGDDIDTEADMQFIAANGAKIEWNIAKELFPRLDITKHKYYLGGGEK